MLYILYYLKLLNLYLYYTQVYIIYVYLLFYYIIIYNNYIQDYINFLFLFELFYYIIYTYIMIYYMLFVLNFNQYVSPVVFQLVLLSEHRSWFGLWMVCHCGGVTTNKPDVHLVLTPGVSFLWPVVRCVVLITLFRSGNPSSFGRPDASFSYCSESAIKVDWISFTGAY